MNKKLLCILIVLALATLYSAAIYPKLIIQSPLNISPDEYDDGLFLIWLNIYNIEGINSFELTISTTDKINFKSVNLANANHCNDFKWQKVINEIGNKEITLSCMVLSETLSGDQSLGYIICQLEDGVNLIESINVDVSIKFSDPNANDYTGEVQLLHRCTDFDKDGVVQLGDIGIFAGKYGTSFGQTEFEPMADYDCDGVVEFDDLGYFVNYAQREYER
jgi:hypothetical protein